MRSRLLTPLLCLVMLSACGKPTVPPPVQPPPKGPAVTTVLSYDLVLDLAKEGNHDAEFELGAMFHDGDGVEQDYAQALPWYRKAANAGNRQAMFNLGMMYKNGEGVSADPAAARGWFVRASDAGDVRAAQQLGTMAYEAKDFAKALQYFLKAAKGELPEAQLNAGVMYVRGEGVPAQDVIEGYAWLTLAKENGNARAASMLESLLEKMTAEEKTAGEARLEAVRKEIKK
ncbi:MAG: sel1 repeat family protein [Candidatus Peribacteraceae bacterium]|nr:sel1 repeat family protein [Candidatus Peribacteraceae bacterium]